MLYVALKNELKITLLNVIYIFKSGDIVVLDYKGGFAFHSLCKHAFDLDRSEYYIVN